MKRTPLPLSPSSAMREKPSLIVRDTSDSVPSCAASCIASAVSRSDCSSDDTLCLCSSGEFFEDAFECAVESCSVDNAESTQDVLTQQCENAIANEVPGPNRPRKSTTSQPEPSPRSTQTSTPTTSRPLSTLITSTQNFNTGSPTPSTSLSLPASTSHSSQSAIPSTLSVLSGTTGSQPSSTSSSIVVSPSPGSTGSSTVSVQRGASLPSSSANSTSTSFPTTRSSLSEASSRRPSTTVIIALAVSLGAVALLALVLSCILCAKRRRRRSANTNFRGDDFEPVNPLSPSSREEITTVNQDNSQDSVLGEAKSRETDTSSVAPPLPSPGDDGLTRHFLMTHPGQPHRDSMALSGNSTAIQTQRSERSTPVGSTSESAAVTSQHSAVRVDVQPVPLRSGLTPDRTSVSMSPLGKLPTPYSEKTASLTTSSTHNLDNAALGWHLRSSQQESDTMLSSQYPVLSPRETASSGVNATIWGSEFMDEEDPPPYEPRS